MLNNFSPNSKLIILMFHGTPDYKPATRYSIHSRMFARQISYLKRNGWQTMLFKDLQYQNQLADKTVVLTFDDGYVNNYEGAFLPLVEQDMKATWFIATDCIAKHARWMGAKTEETRMLSIEQLNEMNRNGMEIASHTCSHPDLTSLTFAQQLKELKYSKDTLETILTEKVSSFAYPYGRYNQDSLIAVEKAGYAQACSVRSGFYQNSENSFLIRRITVFDTDTVSTLAKKLIYADNDVSWNHLSRYYLQRLKHKLHL